MDSSGYQPFSKRQYLLLFLTCASRAPWGQSFESSTQLCRSSKSCSGIFRDEVVRKWRLDASSASERDGGEPRGRGRGRVLVNPEAHNDRNSFLRSNYKEDWGVSRYDDPNEFPATRRSVVEEAFEAIAGTLYNNHKLDPNIANNARSKSFISHRPVRNEVDAGRIGIEIGGAELLFPTHASMKSQQATRMISLQLAAKLSLNESWKHHEESIKTFEPSTKTKPSLRPVLVYCNTIKQALYASQELGRLKQEEMVRNGGSGQTWTKYDQIRIQSITDCLPSDMIYSNKQRRSHGGLASGKVDATRGVVMLIQPTDYNVEYLPPGPMVGAVNHFQKIVAHAAIEELPTVVVSPRFMEAQTPHSGGWDQSGYQQSATYGGMEPPKGPTPWVMRDFTPPAYCWVGNALAVGGRFPPQEEIETMQCQVTRVALTQSIMDEDHSWHLYAVQECTGGTGDGGHGEAAARTTDYVYIASTKSAFGRPTRELIIKILEGI